MEYTEGAPNLAKVTIENPRGVLVFVRCELWWMTRALQNYSLEMETEFYANYAVMLKNITPSGKDKDIRNQPRLDIV